MEKVLFVEPARIYPIDSQGELQLANRKNVSLAGLTVLGSLEEKGFETDFMDLSADGYEQQRKLNKYLTRIGLPDESVIQRITDTKPSALLIGSMFTTEQPFSIDPLTEKVKKAYPNLPVIVGGRHATIKPEWILETGNVDYVVCGEGEETLPELLKNLTNPENVAGIAYSRNGNVNRTLPRKRMQDINRRWALETVLVNHEGKNRYDKDIRHKFFSHNLEDQEVKDGILYYSRGCPQGCDHCTASPIDGRKIRHTGHKRMFEEVKSLYEQQGINVFHNQADTFGLHQEDIKFLEMMKDYRRDHPEIVINNPNAFFARLFFKEGRVNEDLVKLYSEAGFNIMTIAVESFNPNYCKKINFEKITPEGLSNLFSTIHKHGMNTEMYMMYSFPRQTSTELLEDEKVVDGLRDIDVVSWNEFLMFPGTVYYNQGLRDGWFNERDYRAVLKEKGQFCTNVPEEFNFSQIHQSELVAFRKRHAYPK